MAQCDHNWRSALLFIWTRFQGSKDPPDLKEYGSFSTSALICSPHLPSLGLCYSPVPFPNHPSLLGHDSMVSITGSHGWWGLQFAWSLLLCMCYFLWSQIPWTPVTQVFWQKGPSCHAIRKCEIACCVKNSSTPFGHVKWLIPLMPLQGAWNETEADLCNDWTHHAYLKRLARTYSINLLLLPWWIEMPTCSDKSMNVHHYCTFGWLGTLSCTNSYARDCLQD